jgi:hypothetical protein
MALELSPIGVSVADAAPYGGRYPSASLMLDGVWYYGTYCLSHRSMGLNWDVLGPFVGFRTSVDAGETWKETRHTPDSAIFGESGLGDDPVRFGSPHFIDFGKNMEHSPDGFAYMVGHGSRSSDRNLSWISGDDVFLARTRPGLESIDDPEAWEFAAGWGPVAGVDPFSVNGEFLWSSSVSEAKPIVSWPGHVGCVTVTYMPALGRYLMCITDGWPTIREMDSYILESDRLEGPWRIVAFMEEFGKQAYFLNVPSRFAATDSGKAWLCYSANFTDSWLPDSMEADPPGSTYGLCLMEFELIDRA